MHINESAPVTATGTILIAASPEIVWDLLADIDWWPEWVTVVKSTSIPGSASTSVGFRWKAELARLVSTIQTVEPPSNRLDRTDDGHERRACVAVGAPGR